MDRTGLPHQWDNLYRDPNNLIFVTRSLSTPRLFTTNTCLRNSLNKLRIITARFCVQNSDDCLELLSTCLDWTNSAPGMSANALCARLSPDSGPCVPLGAFAELGAPRPQSPRLQHDRQTDVIQNTAVDLPEVTTPCKRNPCAPGSVCLVNRGCRIGRGCKPYRCVAGCKAGEVSHFLVPEDSYARIPTFNGQKGCVKICLCTKKGIEKCQQVPCSQMQSCWLVGKPIGKII
jgi:reversion-inducing-cysteine-rich protein with kazal motifs